MRPLSTTIRPATTWEDALEIRKIRNALAEFMTRDQEQRTVAQQRAWWAKFQRNASCTLYVIENDRDCMGYGLIRREAPSQWEGDHHRALLTGAIKVPYQGLGYGRQLFTFLVCEAYTQKHTPWLDVFTTNGKAYLLYKQLGFVEVSRKDETVTMRHKR